jgi:sugar phosphate isomerase/epimerase
MKFAVCNETFQEWELARGFDFAAECGYTGVEIAPFTVALDANEITSAQRTEIRSQAESAGLEVVGLHWLLAKTEGFHMTTSDVDVRNRTSDYFAALARLCADLGGKVLVCGSPQQRNLQPGVSHEQAMANAAEMFSRVVPVLEETGTTIAIEPLAPTETDFLQTAASAVELMGMIGSQNVQLHLDCKAMSSEAIAIPDLIRTHKNEMVHFHANDPNLQGPGFGELDFTPIFEALNKIEYDGWVSVEVFDYEPGVERLARESIEYMRRCLG